MSNQRLVLITGASSGVGQSTARLLSQRGYTVLRHRTTEWIWVGLMTIIVVTSFGIREVRTWGSWSPIHLLSVFTAVMLPVGVVHARWHRVKQHRVTMIWLSGILMLAPGRIMYDVILGR